MKTGILTFHRATNYGTALQAFATQKACEKIGADAEIIDYRPDYIERTLNRRRLRDAKSAKEVLSVCANAVLYPGMAKRKTDNFMRFIDMLKLSRDVCLSTDDVARISGRYDTVISGSDQLWNKNITADDMTYFLPFYHKHKVSYASSFGESSLPAERISQIAPYVEQFDSIGVREETAQGILSQLKPFAPNIKEAQTVLDPTLLMTKDEWNRYADNSIKLPKNGYILTYYMIETDIMRAITKKLRKQTGLKVVNLKPSKKQVIMHDGKNLAFAGPLQLLECYKNASYVVTNSFHGTAFAINYGVPFYTSELPVSMGGQVNSRLTDILKLFDLTDRWIDSFDKLGSVNAKSELSYKYLNKLENLRESSLNYLRLSLGL